MPDIPTPLEAGCSKAPVVEDCSEALRSNVDSNVNTDVKTSPSPCQLPADKTAEAKGEPAVVSAETCPATDSALATPADARACDVDALRDEAAKVISSREAKAEEKLAAIEKLAGAGVDELVVRDGDNVERTLRIELENLGGKLLVHCFADDDSGRERILLRGISNNDGTYEHQKNANGEDVSFYGSWWTSRMGSKSQIAQISEAEHDEKDLAMIDAVLNESGFNYSDEWDRYGSYGDEPGDLTMSQEELNGLFDRVTATSFGGRRRIGRAGVRGQAIHFRAGMAIDADGSPRARQIDPCGQYQTSLRNPDGTYVNAERIPYIVLPGGQYKHLGVRIGDVAAVRYNGRVEFAVFADVGPSHKIGEGSMALAAALDINNSPTRGGLQSAAVDYIIFPGSGRTRALSRGETVVRGIAALKVTAGHQEEEGRLDDNRRRV